MDFNQLIMYHSAEDVGVATHWLINLIILKVPHNDQF